MSTFNPSSSPQWGNLRDLLSNFRVRISSSAAVAILLFWFQKVKLWENFFLQPSRILYPLSHLLRSILVLVVFYVVWRVGEFLSLKVLRLDDVRSSLDRGERFLFNFLFGTMFSSALIVLLCAGRIFTYPVGATLIVLGIFCFPFERKNIFRGVNTAAIKKLYNILMGIVFICFYFRLFFNQGLIPQISDNDSIGHYFPYYQELLDNFGFIRSHYFFHFFYSKGLGVIHLVNRVSDIQSTQVTNFGFFTVILFLVNKTFVRIVPKSSSLSRFGVVIICLLITESQNFLDFQKLHTVITLYVLGFIYFSILNLENNGEKIEPKLGQAICGGLALFTSPNSFLHLFPILFFQVIFLGKSNQKGTVALFLWLIFIISICLLYNYFFTGLWEYNPRLLFPFSDFERVRKWIDPRALEFQYFLNTDDNLDFYETINLGKDKIFDLLSHPKLGTNIYHYFVVTVMVFGIAIIGVVKRNCKKAERFSAWVVIYGAVLISLTYYSSSFRRFSVFFWYFKAIFLFTVLEYFVSRVYWRRWIKIIPGLILVGYYLVFGTNYLERHLKEIPINFAKGKISYLDVYEGRFDTSGKDCLEASAAAKNYAKKEAKILSLRFVPQCYGFPNSLFVRAEMAEFTLDFSRIYLNEIERQKEVFKKWGIGLFYIDLEGAPTIAAYLPLFSGDSLRDNFKVIWRKNNLVLLALSERSEKVALRLSAEDIQKYMSRIQEDVNKGTSAGRAALGIAQLKKNGYLIFPELKKFF